eukprot:TRINITY_DN3093_c0_g1_i2.p1 TRINITY_DN3093_c0_g1~~TRINITY_DN3093_c0_g1_i2.p1  ORF type:complete len:450 (+),score=67.81 TRINITY_DN3093_c0_g1_i2:828-2177(+)
MSAGIILSEFGEEREIELPSSLECPICMETVGQGDRYAMKCGHSYCLTCWAEYLKDKLNDISVLSTKCPWPDCHVKCSSENFQFFCGSAYERYRKIFVSSYVDLSPYRKWCPQPNCEYCIETQLSEYKLPVSCACRFRFCFKCADHEIGDHSPAGCNDIKEWLERRNSEADNLRWLTANTQQCPKCRSHIEKNGGCMHMTCRLARCRHEFCWLCRGDWRGHTPEACHSATVSKIAVDQLAKSKTAATELELYMGFFHRYESHHKAMKIALNQLKNADSRIDLLLERFGGQLKVEDLTFLYIAAKQLVENRKMLQNSYVYAYYNEGNEKVDEKEKRLFNHLQVELEAQTDKLSGVYEQPENNIEGILDFKKWQADVLNHTAVCKKFLDNFTQGVIEKTLISDFDLGSKKAKLDHDGLRTLLSLGIHRDVAKPLLEQFSGDVQRAAGAFFG